MQPILDNVFIIAACNPLRGDSTSMLCTKKIWHKPSYYVHQLHPTLEFLKWDYGALNNDQEYEYITVKMREFTKDDTAFSTEKLASVVIQSQNKIRKYAEMSLLRIGYSNIEAKKCARSSVSQRDIQRVFDFYKWLLKVYQTFDRYSNSNDQQERAILVALGLVYYIRLTEKDREDYAKFLDDECRKLSNIEFTVAFNEELLWYIEKISFPCGIARTKALQENIFAIIACCQTHTPLIIIGEPGTSKTLSFNLVSSSFNGKASKSEAFRATDVFKGLQPFFYQCSRHTSSNEIESVFQQALQRQKFYKRSEIATYCVVFMDEAGLPEERHESLKVLHYHLDKKLVSFVAITNHALDAAKTNRAISLYRPETSIEDLQVLARDLIRSQKKLTSLEEEQISHFCTTFSDLLKKEKFCVQSVIQSNKPFYGQRDFMHFISFLQRKRAAGFLKEGMVLEALERNLNGHDDFLLLCNLFLDEVTAF